MSKELLAGGPCPTEELLTQFLHSSSDEIAQKTLADHVEMCEPCQAALDRLTSLPADLKPQPLESSAPTLVTVMNRLRRMPRGTHSTIAASIPDVEKARRIASDIDDFDTIEFIGSGGSGVLFRARHVRLAREVAIKIWTPGSLEDPQQRDRVNREAQALARLDDPRIVRVFDFGTTPEGASYLVMEYVAGRPLHTLLRQRGPMAPQRAARLTREVAMALASAHQVGLVHRDVKPANILLQDNPQPAGEDRIKLVDFGLVLDEYCESSITQDGAFAGTPYYMSPEQIIDPHHVDQRSDVYSLGVVLYELLTASRPFQGVMRMVLHQALHEAPVDPRKLDDSIPVTLETICLKAMAKEPGHRYESATALAEDLERWLEHKPIAARRPSSSMKLVYWARSNAQAAALLAGIIGLLAVLGIGGWLASVRIERARMQIAVQRNQALNTLRTMVFEIPDHLQQDDVSFEQAEQSVLEAALAGLEKFTDDYTLAAEAKMQQEIVGTVAIAHARLAGASYWADDLTKAQHHAQQAIDMAQRGYATDPDSPLLLEAESAGLWFLGAMADEQQDLETADTKIRQSLEIDRRRLALDEDVNGVRHDMVSAMDALILLNVEQEDFQTARKLIADSTQLCNALLEVEQFKCAHAHLTSLHLISAEIAFEQGDLIAAQKAADSGLQRLDACEFAACFELPTLVAASYRWLADIAQENGDSNGAQSWLEQGQERIGNLREQYEDHPAADDAWFDDAEEILRAQAAP